MVAHNLVLGRLLEAIADNLDIPKSYYEKAAARHKSLGEWLCRDESTVARFHPHVSAQGSFRYGTVIQPLRTTEEYDLDNVTTLAIAKSSLTQKQVKELYGAEIQAYARANSMLEPVKEKDRCWRLIYADEVRFHVDTLPCLPETRDIVGNIALRGVLPALAELSVAITDRRHPEYSQLTLRWLISNPRGFARWFEQRTRSAALSRLEELVALRIYASVDEIPAYVWKTPLQRSIQILKRHRDVMFDGNADLAPISMIITNLAAQAYAGETDIATALINIVEKMPLYVNASRPRVPNPANPAEDYADKWAKNPQLEENFWMWHAQLQSDLAKLPVFIAGNVVAANVRRIFRVELSQEQLRKMTSQPIGSGGPAVAAAPAIYIPNAPRPWGKSG
jgi:hypothetical protein